jgi:hypothetical protein
MEDKNLSSEDGTDYSIKEMRDRVGVLVAQRFSISLNGWLSPRLITMPQSKCATEEH